MIRLGKEVFVELFADNHCVGAVLIANGRGMRVKTIRTGHLETEGSSKYNVLVGSKNKNIIMIS